MVCDIISERGGGSMNTGDLRSPSGSTPKGRLGGPVLSAAGDPCDPGRPGMADAPLENQGEKHPVQTGNRPARGACFAT